MYFRIEPAALKGGSICSMHNYVADTMDNLGLQAPANYRHLVHPEERFWFTRNGWETIGKQLLNELRHDLRLDLVVRWRTGEPHWECPRDQQVSFTVENANE